MRRPDGEDEVVRILCVHTATTVPMGADTWVHTRIIRGLDPGRYELHVACRPGTPTYDAIHDVASVELLAVDLGDEVSPTGSRWARWRTRLATVRALRSLARLVVHARRRSIRVFHTSDRPRDAFVTVLLAKLARGTSLVHVHVAYNPDWMGWMLRWSIHHADHLIAVSDFVRRTLVEGGCDPDRVHSVRNAIDIDAWVPGRERDEARAQLGLSSGTVAVLTACRLFPAKGPGELIRALALVHETHPDVVLLVLGVATEPAYDVELRRLVVELGLGDHVRFLGRRADVAPVMAASDIFAMPSFEEPFGLVFCEAMAMRLPVVALANGGTLEVVEHERTGLLTAVGDLRGLADALISLVDDPSRRAAMGAAGRQRVEDHFTLRRFLNDLDEVYRLVS